MRKLKETCAFERVCSGCKHLKSKNKKNVLEDGRGLGIVQQTIV